MREIDAVKYSSKCKEMREIVLFRAKKYANQKVITLQDRKRHFTDDPHYYQSLAIYFWPDSTRGDGKYTQRDGVYNPEYLDYDYVNLGRFEYVLKYLSIGYYITNDQDLYKAAITQLKAWFLDKETYMYPNFEYSQVVPGYNNNHGRPEGIIDAYQLHSILESIRLLNSCKPFDYQTMRELKRWFSCLNMWLQNSPQGKCANQFRGNHATNYDLIVYDIALFVGDLRTCKKINNDFGKRRLKDQIDKEGKQPRELNRTRSFFYQIYNLTHIIDVCYLAESNGYHLYKKNSKIINKAIKYLQSFHGKKEEYPCQENGSWKSLLESLDYQIERIERIKKYKSHGRFESRNVPGTKEIIL